MAFQTVPRPIRNPMSDRVLTLMLTLVLCLGALPFLSMQRGLVALFILHLPSLQWRFLHTRILGIALLYPFGDLILDMSHIGGKSNIPSHIPSSSTPVPSNVFLTTHPLPNSSGPSGQSSTISHVHPASSHTVASQGYVPPHVSARYGPSYGLAYWKYYGQYYRPSYGQSYGHPYGTSYGKTYTPY